MVAARSCSATSSPSSSVAGSSTSTLGCERTNASRSRASAGSPGTATPQDASRVKKRPARPIGCASGSRLKSRTQPWSQIVKSASSGSPSSEISSASSAPAGSRPARSSRAQRRARSSSWAPWSRKSSVAASALNGNTCLPSATSVPPGRSSGSSPAMVRITNTPSPSRASTDTSARKRSESVSQSSTAGSASSWLKRASRTSTDLAIRASAGTRQCLRRQSNQRPGRRLTASFRSSSNGKSKTSSGSRGLSASRVTRPPCGAAPLSMGSDAKRMRLPSRASGGYTRCRAAAGFGAYAWRPRDGDRTESGGGVRAPGAGARVCCGSVSSSRPAAGARIRAGSGSRCPALPRSWPTRASASMPSSSIERAAP